MTTPIETDTAAKAELLRKEWADAGREGEPDVRILVAKKPTEQDFADWMSAGASELIWGVPDSDEDKVLVYLDKLASRVSRRAQQSIFLPMSLRLPCASATRHQSRVMSANFCGL